MFGVILKATNSSFQKGMTCCRSIYVKKVMKLLAFIFEQPSYCRPQTYRDALENSFFPKDWNSLAPFVVVAETTEEFRALI